MSASDHHSCWPLSRNRGIFEVTLHFVIVSKVRLYQTPGLENIFKFAVTFQ